MIEVATAPVVRVENLCLSLNTGEPVVEDVSFSVGAGEILGLVGESGSGKTTTALALLGYTRTGVDVRSGLIEVGGQSIIGRDAKSLRSVRGKVVSYVPQDPGGALNPSLRVGDSIMDVLRAHRSATASDESVQAALSRVELGTDARFGERYPHQLSGGQQQRVTIAMACVCEPPVAVLDEPTTGLDVLTQDRILTELARLRDEDGMAMVYVSHDLAVVAKMADRIVVMYAGRVVENGPAADVIERPKHPYTRALVAAIPDFRHPRALQGIPGVSVGVGEWPDGCAFAPRCEHQEDRCCAGVPALEQATEAPRRALRPLGGADAGRAPAGGRPRRGRCSRRRRRCSRSRGWTSSTAMRSRAAVDDVSFSGRHRGAASPWWASRAAARPPSAAASPASTSRRPGGSCSTARSSPGPPAAAPLDQRRRIQIVFQNPFESLNPRHRVGSSIERPLRVLRRLSRGDADREVGELLERVRLPRRVAERFPIELSGGERQRVAIARALAAKPDLLVCDEVTSALDVSVQAAVLELLAELQRDLRLSMLFITHNLGRRCLHRRLGAGDGSGNAVRERAVSPRCSRLPSTTTRGGC